MKNVLGIILLIFFINSYDALSEDEIDIYNVWIEFKNEDSINVGRKGYFYDANDSTIILSNGSYVEDYLENDFHYMQFNASMLQTIKLRKKYKPAKYAFWGFASGFAAGALISVIEGDDDCDDTQGWCIFEFSWQQKIILFGLPLATLVGLPAGIVAGQYKDIYHINADRSNYLKHKETFEQYSIKKQLKNPPPEEDK